MKSYAKLNIFLKITGKSGEYHTLISRFYRLDALFDELYLIAKKDASEHLHRLNTARKMRKNLCKNVRYASEFAPNRLMDRFFQINENLISNFYSPNDIFSKVLSLLPQRLREIFQNEFCLVLDKNIPSFAGLGGASSNAAVFLRLLSELAPFNTQAIAQKSGADVSFFASGLKSANVSGYGEIIEDFSDDEMDFELVLADECSTKEVFAEFAKAPKYCSERALLGLKSLEILKNFSNFELNDLLNPCIKLYPKCAEFADMPMFLSGSGGTFYKLKN